MPGGKRTDHISRRDLEVLEFIARFGVVPRGAVAVWANTADTVTYARERRLRQAGLIEALAPVGESGKLLVCTTAGLRACGRADLRRAKLSFAAVRHEAAVALLAARMERGGERTLSEREVFARERAEGRRLLSAALPDGRYHRADLVRVGPEGEPREAIEVELSAKGAARLDVLLRAWRRAVAERRLSGVVYRCAPRTRSIVERAIERTRTAGAVAVEDI